MRVAASSPAWLTRSWELDFCQYSVFNARLGWSFGTYGAG